EVSESLWPVKLPVCRTYLPRRSSVERRCLACAAEGWEQHLLGTSVVAFILLPLAFSCESNTTKETISQHYEYVIRKQLADIKINIDKQLSSPCRGKKHPPPPPHLMGNPIRYIHNVSCNRLLKDVKNLLGDKVTNLVKEINGSLNCQCSTPQGDQHKSHTVTKVHKKLCKLRHSIEKIQGAYELYNSTT
ncbi:hypothetical protein NFI96_011644, partial [Prochilodus magdalenae]